jgi:hypothetical protein
MLKLVSDLLASKNITSDDDCKPHREYWHKFIILSHDGIEEECAGYKSFATLKEYAIERYLENLSKLIDSNPYTKNIVWLKKPEVNHYKVYDHDGVETNLYTVRSRLLIIERSKIKLASLV